MATSVPHHAEEGLSMKHHILDKGAQMLQSKAPVNAIHQHVCGIHFYNGDLRRQVIAHHYCTHLNEDMHQCVIYDSDSSDAKLIGVEYIITERLFKTLPEEERRYWHSHRFEVKGGLLVAPGLPGPVEKQLMQHLVCTYGKTIHLWQVDRGDSLPLGPPQLMMAFTEEGQVDPLLLKKAGNTMVADLKKQRSDLPEPTELDKADHWRKGEAYQLSFTKVDKPQAF